MRQSTAQRPWRPTAGGLRAAGALRAAAVLAAAGLVLTACTDPDDGGPEAVEPHPEVAAAEALAQALTTGDFSAAPLSEEDRALATEQAEEVLGEVAAVLDRTVEVTWSSSTYEEGEGSAADAALTWTWDVPGSEEDWSYPVSVHLVAADDGPYLTTWSPDLLAPDLGEDEVLTVTQGSAPRGQVLGQDDEVLVTETDIYRIGIDKTYIDRDQWEDQAVELAEALDLDDPEAYADRVMSAGDRAFLVAMEVRQDDPGDVDMDAVRAVEGVNLVPAVRQLGPTPGFATEVLGRVGEATAEIIEASDGAVQQGDQVGLSGLQRAYDDSLRGFGALTISVTTGADDAEPTEAFTAEAVRGQPLRTTLDADLQERAENLLADEDSPSALVAIRPSTGELLAVASGPASQGWSTATLGQYPPGSTFKVVTLLALLRSGMELDDAVSCTRTLDVNGREFENYPGYPSDHLGEITLEQAIAQSCNTALMGQRDQVSAADLASAAEALGLGRGDSVDLGYPVWLGSVPEQAEGTQLAAEMIGQGQVLVSPVAMAAVAASVAAEQRVTPQLVVADAGDGAAQADEQASPGEEGQDGETSEGAEAAEGAEATDTSGEEPSTGESDTAAAAENAPAAAEEVAAPLTHTEATLLQQAMRAVVTDGTGTGLRDVPGKDVLAKTGTAEGAEDTTHGWMIAIQDDLAVAAFVGDGGRGGAATAGPLVEKFLSESGT
ncbi:penicillin-binding transpeptidase domain-containing protein [Ruania albidiflava]|uniref:penicillin-binding transpeptidase domain-containing protein n=1 Tax=Ruania albidiflava TaxID=366586 RepID=UPI0003B6F3D6|nr:penicillin-binding transpeptidase domain-containing protein [Ruania albidiflava]